MERSFNWKLLQIVARLLTTLAYDLKVYGAENIPKTGGVLLAANHQSYLDPVLVAVKLKRPVSYFAKSELFENPYFGRFIRSLHAFPVRQGEGDIGAVKESIHRLQEGHMLNIYPEGSRTEDGEIAPMEKGIALIIRRAGVPVVPVAIDGSFAAWPKQQKLPHAHPIRLSFGKPLRLEKLKPDEILKTLDTEIRKLFNDLRSKRAEELANP